MKTTEEMNDWWSSLTIEQKQGIAYKAYTKGHDEGAKFLLQYPNCTTWWNTLSEKKKNGIFAHCTDKHGMVTGEWNEGVTYSY